MGCGGCALSSFLQISGRKEVVYMLFSIIGLVVIVASICLMVYKSELNIQDFEITLFGVFKIKIKANGKKPR
jgi:hypothetical protein